MTSLSEYFVAYQKQIAKGDVPKFYKGIMNYMLALKNHFSNKYSQEFVISYLHQGYMDVTYFSFVSESLKKKKLKIILAFEHEKMQFAAYFVGQNKQVQKRYWDILQKDGFNKYKLAEQPQDYILEQILAEKPNFNDLDSLTKNIEKNMIKFINDILQIVG